MKKYRNIIRNREGKMLALTTIIILLGFLAVMTEAAPQNDSDAVEKALIEKVSFKGTSKADNANLSRKNRRVKRDFTMFCLYMHTAKCEQFYSDLLGIGDRAKQIDKTPLRRSRLDRINSGRKAKLNSMIGQIKNWQKDRMVDLELCFECEKHLRSYKMNNPPSIRPDFYDIPIPIPENYHVNTVDESRLFT
ncbi:uncharacterized protein LOC117173069 [Belonocnema kinseyi]|uniref:uncharacterized protein LOC117173069 n=1 Tax=Belonocnema kinseyi TaxID=2817044 RepID=UPI00143DFE8B|nr:uncharacterized protein LOC117173069 [Belonocnema kinseyi]